MTKFNKLFNLILLALFIAFSACEDEGEGEHSPKSAFKNGVLVINEGDYSSGSGSISFISNDSAKITNDLFTRQNSAPLASIIQSIAIYGDKILVLANAADKIEVLNGNDLTRLRAPLTAKEYSVPRYFAAVGNKGYVTCWGQYNSNYALDSSYVAMVNMDDFSLTKKIKMPAGPEGILVVDNKVFVANSFTDTISVIVNDAVVHKIKLPLKRPSHMVVDKNKDLWVVCQGGMATNGGIIRLNTNDYSIEKTFSNSEIKPSGSVAISNTKDKIYFISGASYMNNTKVYELNITAENYPATAFVEGQTFYGIGIDPANGYLYIADAPSFASSGKVLRFNSAGQKLDEFTAGVAPNGFVFR